MIRLKLDLETLDKLNEFIGKSQYDFLGFTLDLDKSTVIDNFGRTLSEWTLQILTTLLRHYSKANPICPTGTLVKYKAIPGGYAYEEAFTKRAIEPIAEIFGEKLRESLKAATLLGGNSLTFGDVSFEIQALKGIPLTYILWGREEFPASASILYDASASSYLPTEDLAVLGELSSLRLIEAYKQFYSIC
jgi:hypothetical protein